MTKFNIFIYLYIYICTYILVLNLVIANTQSLPFELVMINESIENPMDDPLGD